MANNVRPFPDLATAQICDACMRLGIPLRLAPPGAASIPAGARLAGPALPVLHLGSVDVFLEACEEAQPGDVLVIDNQGRTDEGCIGDLTVLEAQASGIGGIVVWGAHRDGSELAAIGLPVFSYGACPAGPSAERPRPAGPGHGGKGHGGLRIGDVVLTGTREDVVFADADGIVFVARSEVEHVLAVAGSIRKTERAQAGLLRAGHTLRQQLRFREYLAKHKEDPGYTFRRHLQAVGGAIEV